MNLFADLLASTQAGRGAAGLVTQSGPRIQKGRQGVEIKSAREIAVMRRASRIVATVLQEVIEMAAPGLTTGDLDRHAERRIREMGAVPSFKGYHGFPASICASVNHEVVHGIPSPRRVLRAGDLLKVDTGACYEGYHGDSCVTICVGEGVSE
ncbi:MAG: M24 family metallopeptidase, partial [Synechococcaceae cyanobacterium]|nr:M24 family metallopeptidase [Synechococcaceae cyanobacterium]